MNIVRKIIKKKSNVAFFIKLWLLWSRLYQWMELKFLNIEDEIGTTHTGNFKHPTVILEWSNCCKRFKLFHYSADKWDMLWDVISNPLRVLYRKGLDCDDYARLGYHFAGETFDFLGDKYTSIGMVVINWNDGTSHAIWVWLNESKADMMVLSNDVMSPVASINDIFGKMNGDIKWLSVITPVNPKGEYNVKKTYLKYQYTTSADEDDYRSKWGMKHL